MTDAPKDDSSRCSLGFEKGSTSMMTGVTSSQRPNLDKRKLLANKTNDAEGAC
jgi:hypothetical protein